MGEVVAALLIGLAGGSFAGLLGVGGGTLYVPAMVLLLGTDQHVAQGVSLVVIIPTAISATQRNLKGGYVDRDAALWVTPFAVLAALGGAFLAGFIPGEQLSRIFGVMVLYVGARTLITTWRRMRRDAAAARAEVSG
ncbi:MAG: TSUP family transporter [Dehalococcoidia bacterium]|nr:TSUP family transporter [Dehalococcoidia bacterium]